MDKIADIFIRWADWDARQVLGEDCRRPMPIEEPDRIGREDYNRLVRFVRERLG